MKGLQHPAVIAFLDARSLGRYETAARDFRSATRETAMPGERLRGTYALNPEAVADGVAEESVAGERYGVGAGRNLLRAAPRRRARWTA